MVFPDQGLVLFFALESLWSKALHISHNPILLAPLLLSPSRPSVVLLYQLRRRADQRLSEHACEG